ncbi:MAG: hypothetical protein E7480_05415 [Ruminococcaceae bacterium]|nr:hypothetical protein [Oscillospiraceae bacterium]
MSSKTKTMSILLYIGAIVTTIIAVINFIFGIIGVKAFFDAISQEGMAFSDIIDLFSSNPAIYQTYLMPVLTAIALYGGIALLLFGMAHRLKVMAMEEIDFLDELDAVDYSEYTPAFEGNEEEEIPFITEEIDEDVVDEAVEAASEEAAE